MAGYVTNVKRDIARWVEAGLIDAQTAVALSLDVEQNHRGVSLGSALSMMAAALFAAAILLVVAANWEAIPRLVRILLLFAILVGGYAGGALLKLRGRDALAETCWVLAATAFGASIALIGQMYHLSGDEKQAILIWCIGTALAAAALRSPQLNVGAALLAIAWLLMQTVDGGNWPALPYPYFVIGAALYLLSFWTGSRPSRHLLVLSLSLFVLLDHLNDENLVSPLLLAAFAVVLFAVDRLRPGEARRYSGLGSGLPVQALLAFLTATGILQISRIEQTGFLAVSIAVFAGIIAVLLLSGRDNAMLRRLAYAAFSFQLCFIYVVMFGSMIDTAGFFILGGLVLSVLAWAIGRLERRFSLAPASLQKDAS